MIQLFEEYHVPFWVVVLYIISYSIYNYLKQKRLNKSHVRLQKQIDNLNHKLDLKNHVSKYEFDLEIHVYRELFNRMIDAEDRSDFLLPVSDIIPKDKKQVLEIMHSRDDKFCKAFDAFTRVSRKNKPFYRKEFYTQIDSIIKIMKELSSLFKMYYFSYDNSLKKYAQHNINYAYKSHKTIHNKIDVLTDAVRSYLDKLTKY